MNEKISYYKNLNAIRVFLAALVTFSHCYPLSGGKALEPISTLIPTETGGSIAVKAFFFISGFLVTKSWIQSNNIGHFIISRAIRILPALTFALVLTIALAYISTSVNLKVFIVSSLDYFIKNITLFSGVSYELPGAYTGQASTSVNGSLWTLPWEVRAYLGLVVVGAFGVFEKKILANLLLIIFATVLFFPVAEVLYDNNEVPLMLFSFVAGVFFAVNVNRDKIAPLGVVMVLVGGGLLILGIPRFGVLFLIFGVISLIGFTDFLTLPRFKNDISFGIYVYSFPVQQIILYFSPSKDPVMLFLLTLAFVCPLSFASWLFIESPVLKNRKRIISGLSFFVIPRSYLLIFCSISLVFSSIFFYKKIVFSSDVPKANREDFYWGIYFHGKNLLSLRKGLTSGNADIDMLIDSKVAVPLLSRWRGNEISLALFNRDNCTFTFYEGISLERKISEQSLPCLSSGAQPLAGDWYGDGKLRIGMYFSDLGLVSLEGKDVGNIEFLFGMPNSNLKAISGDWNNDGVSTIAVWNPRNSQFDFNNKNEAAFADMSFKVSSSYGALNIEPFAVREPDGTYLVGTYDGMAGVLRFFSLSGGSELFTLEYGDKGSKGMPVFLNN